MFVGPRSWTGALFVEDMGSDCYPRCVPKIVVLIDGGNVRVLSRQAGRPYVPDFIERIAHACAAPDEVIHRILYYDCAPFTGTVRQPVSGQERVFDSSDGWLRELARRDLFAVREGVLKFRGFRPKRVPVASTSLTDADFEPVFEQKGVDMRIGLDMMAYCTTGTVDRIALMTQDTDCVPAMKSARRAGLQVCLVRLPNSRVAAELLEHADFVRTIPWPA